MLHLFPPQSPLEQNPAERRGANPEATQCLQLQNRCTGTAQLVHSPCSGVPTPLTPMAVGTQHNQHQAEVASQAVPEAGKQRFIANSEPVKIRDRGPTWGYEKGIPCREHSCIGLTSSLRPAAPSHPTKIPQSIRTHVVQRYSHRGKPTITSPAAPRAAPSNPEQPEPAARSHPLPPAQTSRAGRCGAEVTSAAPGDPPSSRPELLTSRAAQLHAAPKHSPYPQPRPFKAISCQLAPSA